MSSTAEELASQAGQLQETISFFRVDDDGRSMNRQTLARTQKTVANKLNTAHVVSEVSAKPQAVVEAKETAVSGGVALVMDDNGSGSDSEFEKY